MRDGIVDEFEVCGWGLEASYLFRSCMEPRAYTCSSARRKAGHQKTFWRIAIGTSFLTTTLESSWSMSILESQKSTITSMPTESTFWPRSPCILSLREWTSVTSRRKGVWVTRSMLFGIWSGKKTLEWSWWPPRKKVLKWSERQTTSLTRQVVVASNGWYRCTFEKIYQTGD